MSICRRTGHNAGMHGIRPHTGERDPMDIKITKMETDDEIRGKAFVHWKAWHEAYQGLVSQAYLDALTLEKCEKMAYSWPDGIIVAKDGGRVIGFAGFGQRDEAPESGELFALYVLSEYYGTGVGQLLMQTVIGQLRDFPQIRLWVLKGNGRAIRFYQKCGFYISGEEQPLPALDASEIRMILEL